MKRTGRISISSWLRSKSVLQRTGLIMVLLSTLCLIVGCSEESEMVSPSVTLDEHPIYSSYEFSSDDRTIDFGGQPYLTSAAIISEFMARDPILEEELKKLGFTLKSHHFLKGADINHFMLKGDLEMGVGGDMPSLTIASQADVSLLSIFKNSVSIVSKDIREITGLKGKKVAYAFGSNAHFFLLDTLQKYDLTSSDVDLVAMDITLMPRALQRDEIDAYSTWEYTPSTTMKVIQDKLTVRKGFSYGFLYIRDAFFASLPDEVIHLLLASNIRAINWLKADSDHTKLMSYWLYSVKSDWDHKEIPLALDQVENHVNEAIGQMRFGGYPRIPLALLQDGSPLDRELQFLAEQGFVSPQTRFGEIRKKTRLDYLLHVLQHPDTYKLFEFGELGRMR